MTESPSMPSEGAAESIPRRSVLSYEEFVRDYLFPHLRRRRLVHVVSKACLFGVPGQPIIQAVYVSFGVLRFALCFSAAYPGAVMGWE